jgi:flagellin-like hook-associated protein FlgL
MSRITGILAGAELQLLNRLAAANAAATLDSLRLAAKKRILAPRDEPSTFVALSGLQSQLTAVVAAMANAAAASSAITQAQSSIDQIGTQLDTIRTELLKDESRTLTPAQRAASQAVIDQAISQINNLAGATIDGRRLLDGSGDFVVTGRNASQVARLAVWAKPPGASMSISGTVTQAATQGQLVYNGSDGKITSDATFTLTGQRGSMSLSVTTNEPLSQVATAINNTSHVTGVTASVAGNDLTLTGVDYGSQAAISITVTSGIFTVTGTGAGQDAQATINGRAYTVSGNRFVVSDNGFAFQLDLADGFSGALNTIAVSGDALRYQLSPTPVRPDILAIPALTAINLGGTSGRLDQIASGGPYSGLDANTSRAIRIVDEARGVVDLAAGNVGGFYNASISSASALLSEMQTNLEDTIAQTDGYDEARETALLAQHRQLAANCLAGLSILYQQRAAVVQLLQHIAGLTSG